MIKTVIFDLSEVYLRGIWGSHVLIEKILGIDIKEEYFYNVSFNKFMLGEITEDDYLKTIIVENSWDITVEQLKHAIRENFKEIAGTRKIIEKLEEKGYDLVLLSNHGKEWIEYCEAHYDFHKLFKEVIYSYQVKKLKPNKDIFTYVLTNLHLKPKETLFIDDNQKNIVAARTNGMWAIQFSSPKKLMADLSKFNISV